MIYICTHKDFTSPDEGEFTIISNTKLNNEYKIPVIYANNELNPLKGSYCEGLMIYDIWKNDTTSDYIGINHYRRYFMDYEPNTTILPAPLNFNIYSQYGECHYINDLLTCKDIINELYPTYRTDYIIKLYQCNMFVLPRQDFNKYCKFVFGVLDKYNEKLNLHSDEDVRKYVSKHFPSNRVDYQARLHGFLMERLGSIFFENYYKETDFKISRVRLV